MRTSKNLILSVILLSIICPAFAVNTAKIDAVRGKETLTDDDTAVIEQFVSEAFTEFLAKTDFTDIAALRTAIVSKSSSERESGQIQYGPRYFAAAQKEITNTLTKINELPDSPRKTMLTMNLMIIISDLASPEIAKIALDYLQNQNIMIRYWAVSSLTNANITKQLNYTENSSLAEQIAKQLASVAKTEQADNILVLLAQCAAELKQPAANDILTTIAQKRIDLYTNWQVQDEMPEIPFLKAMLDRTQTDTDSAKVMAKNFSILYSLVIQRYALAGQNINKGKLASVITQSEKLLTRFIPDWQGSLKRAVEKNDGAALLTENESLFGSATAAGKIPTAAGFDYGKNPNGSPNTAPPTLTKPTPEKPQEAVK